MKKVVFAFSIATFCYSATINGEFISGYEEWKLPEGEKLGVNRSGILINFTPYWYGGVNLYGATKGKRGGLFVFGFESGLQTNPKKLINLRSGLFIGAGGGGAAPQGGGLMARGYIEGRVNTKYFSIGAGVSRVNFLNGDIKSTQFFSSIYLPFKLKYKNNTFSPFKDIPYRVFLKGGKYFVDKESKTTNNLPQQDFSYIAIEMQADINRYFFLTYSLAGGTADGSDGYMESFTGLGVKSNIFNLPLTATLSAELGLGGGGKVDTGGGSMARVRSSLFANINNFLMGIEAGYTKSFKGSFKAKNIGFFIGYNNIFSSNPFKKEKFAIRALNKVHLTSKGDFKDNTRDDKIYLLGMAIDKYLTSNFYITGQSLWAYKGNSGGYTEGLIGVGYIKEFNNVSLRGEALIGAAGGGGVKTGSAIGSINATIGINFAKNYKIEAGVGYTKAKKGLSSMDIIAAISYKFNISSK